ncbi:MAG: LamG-like jellyroll fold domain-containing protein [bacterium]
MKTDCTKAFTLIELLVVISIIGLLSSIVLTSLEGGEQRAITGKAMEFSHTVRVSLGADLVGEWKFDEGMGTTTKDSSGSDNDGTLIDNPQWVDGIFGKALEFDGSNNYVNCGANVDDFIEDKVTIEAWIKPNATQPTAPAIIYISGRDRIELYQGKFYFYISTLSGSTNLFTGSWVADKWQHIVAIYDGSYGVNQGYFAIYKNAELEGSQVSATVYGSIVKTSENSLIGRYATMSFNGLIDEVRAYNRALSMAEIQQLYAEGAARHGLVLNQQK